VVQVVMPVWVRPHLASPRVSSSAITSTTLHGIRGHGPVAGERGPTHVDSLDVGDSVPGVWELSHRTVRHGTAVHTVPSWVIGCLPPPGTRQVKFGPREQACFDRLAREGYRQQVTYQPAAHYWTLQWRETGLLLAGAALLSGACFWRIRRLV